MRNSQLHRGEGPRDVLDVLQLELHGQARSEVIYPPIFGSSLVEIFESIMSYFLEEHFRNSGL